jgi:hypothetical protein
VRCVTVVLLASTAIARADEPIELRDGLTRDPTDPLLHVELALRNIDTLLRSNTEGYEADVKRERFDFSIGARTRASIESSAWENPLLAGNGWGASLRLVHDFKVIQIGVEASIQRVDSGAVEAAPGTHGKGVHRSYVFLGASATKTKRLSKWMTAWISLTVGRRKWLGDEPLPPGESNDNAGMLSIGTTFR